MMMNRFYTAGTPNGQKISITLEELGIKYETTHIDISKNVQKEDWYLKINRTWPSVSFALII
jgi:glutathione S-transferase